MRADEVAGKAAKDVAALRDKLAADADVLRARIQSSNVQLAECQEVAALLAGLPERSQRDFMVPLGSAAFVPGLVSNASKCLVRVGERCLALPHSPHKLPHPLLYRHMLQAPCLWAGTSFTVRLS